jgi:hypothetical protein
VRYRGSEVVARGGEAAPKMQTAEVLVDGVPMVVQYDPRDPRGTMTPIGRANEKSPLVNVDTGDPEFSVFQKQYDEEMAKVLVPWVTGGGADTIKSLKQINEVANKLQAIATGESKEDLTGFLIGLQPDLVLAGTNPNAVDAKQLVEQVVQRNLRAVLGAQFTQKEGDRLIARAYNPSLEEKYNAARLKRLVTAIEARAQQLNSLADYTLRNGTAVGWDGSIASVDDILAEMNAVSGGANTPQTGQNFDASNYGWDASKEDRLQQLEREIGEGQ